MHEPQTIQRFIALRAQGWAYTRLVTELHVSKPTLIAWSRKHQFEILKTLPKRKNVFGKETVKAGKLRSA